MYRKTKKEILDFFERHSNKVNWYTLSHNAIFPLEFLEKHLYELD